MATRLAIRSLDGTRRPPARRGELFGAGLWRLLYLGTSNGSTGRMSGRAGAPAIIVLDKHSGRLVAMRNRLSRRLYHAQWSSPSRPGARQTLVFFSGGDAHCYAFEDRKAPENRQR